MEGAVKGGRGQPVTTAVEGGGHVDKHPTARTAEEEEETAAVVEVVPVNHPAKSLAVDKNNARVHDVSVFQKWYIYITICTSLFCTMNAF